MVETSGNGRMADTNRNGIIAEMAETSRNGIMVETSRNGLNNTIVADLKIDRW